MGWLGWGLYAARRMSRGRRRQPYFYTNLGVEIVSHYMEKSAQKKRSAPTATNHAPPKTLTAPSSFHLQDSWNWDESDREYYRYATEKWKVHTFEHWGVLGLPAGKDACHNFFGIIRVHQEDDRGSLAHGAGASGNIDSDLPVLLLFRISDGYQDGFAAVQSWSLIEKLIEQDRPLQEGGKYPRALLPP